MDDHLALTQAAIKGARKLGLDKLPVEAEVDRTLNLTPLERHFDRIIWFSLVEIIHIYAFEYEDQISLPSLAPDFMISNVNDAYVEGLLRDEGIEEEFDTVYTDASYIRSRLEVLLHLQHFLRDIDDAEGGVPEFSSILRMQHVSMNVAMTDDASKYSTRGKLISMEEEIAALIVKSTNALQTEDKDKVHRISACLLWWPASYGREVAQGESIQFLRDGFMQ